SVLRRRRQHSERALRYHADLARQRGEAGHAGSWWHAADLRVRSTARDAGHLARTEWYEQCPAGVHTAAFVRNRCAPGHRSLGPVPIVRAGPAPAATRLDGPLFADFGGGWASSNFRDPCRIGAEPLCARASEKFPVSQALTGAAYIGFLRNAAIGFY